MRGILIVVSGFSGVGKGTVIKRLMEKYEGRYALSVSATTRNPREGEIEGREYFFRTEEEFEEMIARGELIEYAKYVSHYYGTPKAYVEQNLEAGKDVILEIEIQGALNVKKAFPDTPLLFIAPPSAQELRNRLIGRGSEKISVVKARLKRAAEESEYMPEYDYLVINDVVEDCVDEVHKIICMEHNKCFRNKELVSKIQGELKEMKNRLIDD